MRLFGAGQLVLRIKYFVKFLTIGFLLLNTLFSCVRSPVRKPGKSGRKYSPHLWQAFDKSVAYSWEILHQEANDGEVLLSTGDLILRPDHIQENPPLAWKYYEILMDIRKSLQGKESQ